MGFWGWKKFFDGGGKIFFGCLDFSQKGIKREILKGGLFGEPRAFGPKGGFSKRNLVKIVVYPCLSFFYGGVGPGVGKFFGGG